MNQGITKTDIRDLMLVKRGKVRDVYELDDQFLIVATDRISAYDVVLPDAVPGKGKILNQISAFWFDQTAHIVDNHLITADIAAYPDVCQPYREQLQGRSMLVKKADPLAIECVVRGYITGSGWKDYQKTGTVCGIKLPEGLEESQKLPEPLFTPSTKAEMGLHDENIDFAAAQSIVGPDIAAKVRDLSLAIYNFGVAYALQRGIIIADTKFEFGISEGKLILIDEVLTPDSSRFWPQADYRSGEPQKSFDKQYVRDYLTASKWNKTPPGPTLPQEVISHTQRKYQEAFDLLTR